MGKRKHKARQKFLDSLTEEEKIKRGDIDTMLFIPLITKEEPVGFWAFARDGKLLGNW